MEPRMVPWYPSDLPEEGAEGEESSSDEEVVLSKTMKKKRGRKQKVPLDDQESNAVTTDDGAQVSSRLSRMEINEIVGVVEPVTSTSGMTARGTSTASYSTAAMQTIEISTAHNAISSANTSLPGSAAMHQVELQPLPQVPHAIRVAPEIQQYWTGKANRWQMSSLGVRYVGTIYAESRDSSRNQPGTRSVIHPTHAHGCGTISFIVSTTRNQNPEAPNYSHRLSKHRVDTRTIIRGWVEQWRGNIHRRWRGR